MHHLVVVALALVLTHLGVAASQPQPSDMWITVTPSETAGGTASVRVIRSEMYIGDPAAFVGPPAPKNATGPNLVFSVRAWKQGDKARVVVYARLEDRRAPDGTTETPIATFVIAPGQSIEVRETEKWGGPRLTVTAEVR
jgi:hypothetical protein